MSEYDENLDIFEGTDENGNPVRLESLDYFFYNGDEYVILAPVDEEDEACAGCDAASCEGCEACGAADMETEEDEEEEEPVYYIMKIIPVTGENGEELEELEPVEDEALAKKLIEIANTRLDEDEDPE